MEIIYDWTAINIFICVIGIITLNIPMIYYLCRRLCNIGNNGNPADATNTRRRSITSSTTRTVHNEQTRGRNRTAVSMPHLTSITYENSDQDIVNVFGYDVPGKIETFEEARLADKLLKNLYDFHNIMVPTTIQKFAIPVVMRGNDIIISAQSDFGKTLSLLIPMLNHLITETSNLMNDNNYCNPSALVVASSRKQIVHICTTAVALCKGTSIRCNLLYAGTTIKSQKKQLALKRKGIHIVFANAPRLVHFLNHGLIKLCSLKFLVFCEADDMGLSSKIKRILSDPTMVPLAERSTILLSTKLPVESKNVQQLAYACQKPELKIIYVHNIWTPVESSDDQRDSSIAVRNFIQLNSDKKTTTLIELIKSFGDLQHQGSVVFVQKKKVCDHLANLLCNMNIPAISIYQDQTQAQCKMALHHLKTNTIKVLVKTDVNFGQLNSIFNFVINYDLPNTVEEYVRRIAYVNTFAKNHTMISFYDPTVDRDLGLDIAKYLIDEGREVPQFLLSQFVEEESWTNNESSI